MFKCLTCSFALLILTNISHAAVLFVDNFNSEALGTEWSANESINGGELNQNNGVFEFTGTFNSGTTRTRASYTNDIRLSAASDWTVSVDMHLAALSSFGEAPNFAGIFAINTLSVSNGFSSTDRVQFNMVLTDTGSDTSHGYRFASDTGGSPDFDDQEFTNSNDTAQDATLYLLYDASEQQITAAWNTGSGIESFSSSIADTSSWVLGAEEFVINLESLIGPIDSDPEGDGLKNVVAVDSGLMSFDNFTITVPEPASYALLLGLLTLGCAATQRKR
jgi:hypothetical protein